ncbi:hypothetical protein ACFO5K_25230 [Nocardia halotolerans]|uniref:Uncharacterized protein n=1 Tax=Nocardia halotolerans TaxID=1755878 RepID=A0ABV8VRW6_9NOCA
MSDDRSIDPADTEITALAQQVATARGKLPLQHDTALYDALSDAEIRAERELAEWIREQRRKQRRRAVADELAAEQRDRRTGALIRRTDEADARWHRKALAARRRVSSADARLAQLYRRAEWSSRALIGVVVLGMVWAGVNVQRNLVPSGDMSDPLYWLSYGIEAMISIPIIVIMVTATTAARWGRELERGKVILFEVALLGTTVALNAGPHLATGSFGRAAEYAIAPVMVGVVIWLHAWVAARYALLIESASVQVPGDASYSPADRVDSVAAPVQQNDAPAVMGSDETASGPDQRSGALNAGESSPVRPTAREQNGARDEEPLLAVHRPTTTAADERGHSRRPSTDKMTAPGTLGLLHKTPADQHRNGSTNGVNPASRRIPVTAAAQATAGEATGTDPVPEATVHADTVARDLNGDTFAPTPVVAHNEPQPLADEPEQLTLTAHTAEQLSLPEEPDPTPTTPKATALPPEPATPEPDSDALTDEPSNPEPEPEPDTPVDEFDYEDTEVRALARQIAAGSPLRLTLDQIEQILELTDQSLSARSVGAEVGVSGPTVTNIVDYARKLRHPYAFTG